MTYKLVTPWLEQRVQASDWLNSYKLLLIGCIMWMLSYISTSDWMLYDSFSFFCFQKYISLLNNYNQVTPTNSTKIVHFPSIPWVSKTNLKPENMLEKPIKRKRRKLLLFNIKCSCSIIFF